jgi:hypothetical protein
MTSIANDSIPPNTPLVFEVELLTFVSAEALRAKAEAPKAAGKQPKTE